MKVKLVDLQIYDNLKTKPYKHQIECFKYGKEHDKFLLADEQGLGKTREAIDIACYKKKHFDYKHCLIICGVNGLKYNWLNEVHTHSYEDAYILGQRMTKHGISVTSNEDKLADLENIDELPYFIITNIETLRYKIKTGNKIKVRGKLKDEIKYPISEKLKELRPKINMIVADECHKMKNPESEQGEQFLSTYADTMIAMTGTPIMNNPLDLYIILNWLGYEEHSFYQYKVHYCRLGGYGGYEIIGFKHLDQIQDILDKMMLRRLKSDVLDLPEKIYITEYVEMSTKQTKIYNEIRNELLCNVDLIAATVNPLSELIRLRQATGYTGILSSTVQESAKLDRLEELVSDTIENGQKLIIFSNWTSMTDIIEQRLSKYKPKCITGKTPEKLRNDYVTDFQTQSNSKILIGTVGAMGTGLTLTAATTVIFFDEPWNRAIRDQAEDRAHRIGTILPINIYFLLTKNTIDERIHDIVETKGKISDALIDNKLDVNTINYLLS
jgi:SNF2 family DNA or RNA helicase